ncbi:PilZ domain-containing protein [Thiohalobacter sp. IOR34]|uniref:PilZ domain-containing protein n=1 Tax=Thiohalobacter sp. IOR34 TaxID=3057176 RepID=UPI0025AFAF9A|nr:PilZ domain-containing protein [Thiohalobacter sp. IOR34]WJW74739.1 PilZ domain-containing protein [Thiohalobacter sp. IOR34]
MEIRLPAHLHRTGGFGTKEARTDEGWTMARGYEEKREFMRMLLDCELQCQDVVSGERLLGRAHDLSSEGLAFSLERSFAPGDRLEVRIEPERALVPPLHAEVEVLRVEPAGPGGGFRHGARILAYR